MRPPVAALLVVLAALAAPALAACGGDGAGEGDHAEAESENGGEGGEAAREEQEREEAAKGIAVEDRVAYYQLTTTSGLLRARLAAERQGDPPVAQTSDAALRAAAGRVRRTEPKDKGLGAARREILAVAAVVEGDPSSKAAIDDQLDRIESINADLSRFLAREPAQAVLVPD